MSELKRCPFCGGKAEVRSRCNDYETDNFVMHFARCNNCKAESAWCREETEAIKAWNTRKPVEKAIERLEERAKIYYEEYEIDMYCAFKEAIEIVKEGLC